MRIMQRMQPASASEVPCVIHITVSSRLNFMYQAVIMTAHPISREFLRPFSRKASAAPGRIHLLRAIAPTGTSEYFGDTPQRMDALKHSWSHVFGAKALASLTNQAANLRQLAGLTHDEGVRHILTDLADECAVLVKAKKSPLLATERRRLDWVEYKSPELARLQSGEREDELAKRSDRRLMLGATIGLVLWGLILVGCFAMSLRMGLQII